MTERATRVEVSRTVPAPPADVFAVLSDPRRHIEFDGSGMLRGTLADGPVSGVGDEFAMRMWYARFGDYVMVNRVVEFVPDRHIAWEPYREGEAEDMWHHRWGYELSPEGEGTRVTEYYDCSRVPEEAERLLQGGTVWLEAMTKTLGRLEKRFSRGEQAEPSAPSRTVGAVTLFSDDLSASRAFYEKVFEAQPVFEDGDSACFSFGALLVNLLAASAARELIAPLPVAAPGSGARAQLTIFVDDVDGVAAEFAGRGVQFVNGPMDRPWGMRTACFADPSGHLWELASELA